MTAAIVVAGGRSRRFGSDKLRHRVDGVSLFERTLRAARVFSPVVVVTANDLTDELLAAGDGSATPVSAEVIAVSEYPRWGGPCAALAAGVDALGEDDKDLIVLPADLADPDEAVATLLDLREGVLSDERGWPQWLVARTSLSLLRERLSGLRSRVGGLDNLPASAVMSVVATRAIVAEHTIRDIDTPADLDRSDQPREGAGRGTG
jgi:molybdopterin-guanine dinucleotide biosynthesis protein A